MFYFCLSLGVTVLREWWIGKVNIGEGIGKFEGELEGKDDGWERIRRMV